MHLGEIKFKKKSGKDDQAQPDGTEAGGNIAKLLGKYQKHAFFMMSYNFKSNKPFGERLFYLHFTGIDTDTLYENFAQPKIKVGAEWVTKGQNTAQANNSVAGIARAIFERQFRYLVIKCNESLVDPTMRR